MCPFNSPEKSTCSQDQHLLVFGEIEGTCEASSGKRCTYFGQLFTIVAQPEVQKQRESEALHCCHARMGFFFFAVLAS